MRKTAFIFTAIISLTAAQLSSAQSNGRIAFQSDRTGRLEIFVMDVDGSNPVQVTDSPGSNEMPSLALGGDQISFASKRDGDYEIYKINADGTNPVNLTHTEGADRGPVWSPDGTRIAFWSRRDGNAEIYVMNADGSDQVNLTNNSDFFEAWPTWSPDGEKLLFISDPGRESYSRPPVDADIVVMNADGSNQVKLTNNGGAWIEGYAVWSPNGTQVAYEISDALGRNYDVWVMNADGTGQKNLTTTGSELEAVPRWSPDGSQIAYFATTGGTPNIWVMNADGTNKINLTNDDQVTDVWPSWAGVADLTTLIEAISWGQFKALAR